MAAPKKNAIAAPKKTDEVQQEVGVPNEVEQQTEIELPVVNTPIKNQALRGQAVVATGDKVRLRNKNTGKIITGAISRQLALQQVKAYSHIEIIN